MTFFHAFLEFFAITDNARFNHFPKQVIPFAGTFPYSGKYREPVVFLGNVIDKLHDKYGLTHTSTTEQTDLTPFGIRFKQVDYLDTGKQHFL